MLINPNSRLFDRVPDLFVSPFPGADTYADDAFRALLARARGTGSVGQELLTQAGAQVQRHVGDRADECLRVRGQRERDLGEDPRDRVRLRVNPRDLRPDVAEQVPRLRRLLLPHHLRDLVPRLDPRVPEDRPLVFHRGTYRDVATLLDRVANASGERKRLPAQEPTPEGLDLDVLAQLEAEHYRTVYGAAGESEDENEDDTDEGEPVADDDTATDLEGDADAGEPVADDDTATEDLGDDDADEGDDFSITITIDDLGDPAVPVGDDLDEVDIDLAPGDLGGAP